MANPVERPDPNALFAMLGALRRSHDSRCKLWDCTCGAEEHNACLDAAIAFSRALLAAREPVASVEGVVSCLSDCGVTVRLQWQGNLWEINLPPDTAAEFGQRVRVEVHAIEPDDKACFCGTPDCPRLGEHHG